MRPHLGLLMIGACLASLASLLGAGGAQAEDDDLQDLEDANEFYNAVPGYDTRMSGGQAVTEDSAFPYLVQIKPWRSTPGASQPPNCVGVIIKGSVGTTATPYVLTSARCALAGDLLFVTGGAVRNGTANAKTESVLASAVLVHEEFLRNMQTADLAVFKLSSIISFATTTTTSTNISPAKLPTIENMSRWYLKKAVTMVGWGYPNNGYHRSTSLHQVSSWVLANWYCRVRNLGVTVTASHLCTSGLPNKGPCTGDAGAPLILRSGNEAGTVIGLATYVPNNGCTTWGRPAVFTRISSYLNWIVANTGFDPDSQT